MNYYILVNTIEKKIIQSINDHNGIKQKIDKKIHEIARNLSMEILLYIVTLLLYQLS